MRQAVAGLAVFVLAFLAVGVLFLQVPQQGGAKARVEPVPARQRCFPEGTENASRHLCPDEHPTAQRAA